MLYLTKISRLDLSKIPQDKFFVMLFFQDLQLNKSGKFSTSKNVE